MTTRYEAGKHNTTYSSSVTQRENETEKKQLKGLTMALHTRGVTVRLE